MAINVLGVGGSLREGSQSEQALRIALQGAADAGARTSVFTGAQLLLPFYDIAIDERSTAAQQLVEAIRDADGLVVVSPGYHGGMSGLVKNAIDYAEDLHHDDRPYLDGRAVGTVAVAFGWQAAVTTLDQLRTTVHALRGWPTPMGGAVNSVETKFDDSGGSNDDKVTTTLRTIGKQVVDFAEAFAGRP